VKPGGQALVLSAVNARSAFLKTSLLGGLVAALVGVAAGQYFRPELAEAHPGRTLIYSHTPDLAEVDANYYLAYTPNDAHAFAQY
jgi:hypothetical protein